MAIVYTKASFWTKLRRVLTPENVSKLYAQDS
jgi:hypothetical protein